MKKKDIAWMVSTTDSSIWSPCRLTFYVCFFAEVEMEETWLKEAGLFFLVSGIASSEASLPLPEAVISTLTHQQAAIVRARLDNYNETLRKRNRQPLRDVRDIFAEVGN